VPRPAVTNSCARSAPNASTAGSPAGVWTGGATGGTGASWPIVWGGELWLRRSRCVDAAAGIGRWSLTPPKRCAGSTRGPRGPPYRGSGVAHGPQRTRMPCDAAACPTLPPACPTPACPHRPLAAARRPCGGRFWGGGRPPAADAAAPPPTAARRAIVARPRPPRAVAVARPRGASLGNAGSATHCDRGGALAPVGRRLPWCRLGATAPRACWRRAAAGKREEGETPGGPLV